MNTETLGRKKTTIICLLITTGLEIAIAFLLDHDTAAIVLYVLIQFFLTMPHTLYSIYAVEIFPSNVRNLAYGVIGAFANCKNIFINFLLKVVELLFLWSWKCFLILLFILSLLFLLEFLLFYSSLWKKLLINQ